MKQEEKSRRSNEHILSCAFTEFAEQGYRGASVNAICSAGKIPKGSLYHYFKDKDALYLACVRRCFNEITEYLSSQLDAVSITPEQYFDVRLAYFMDNPLHQKLFCDAVINVPQHLREEVRSCRSDFDRLNEILLAAILEKESLADGITIVEAIRQLQVFEDFVSVRLRNMGQENLRAEEHNQLCKQTFHTMLFGLIAR